MHPLDGPHLKLRRAESEIKRLSLAEQSFRRDSKYEVVRAEFNTKTGKYRYRVQIRSAPPDPQWGVWIGEIAHNLRSALDGLVYQLALLNLPKGEAPTRDTQFPIFLVGKTTRKRSSGNLIWHFENARVAKRIKLGDGRKMIRQVKGKHQAMIEGLQPYKRGRGGQKSPLYWLQEVNNADKHRFIQVIGSKTGLPPFISGGEDFKYPFRIRPGMILKDGAIFGEAAPSVHVDSKLIPLVAFWEGCPPVKGKAVVNTLRIITECVSKIIEDFAPEFS